MSRRTVTMLLTAIVALGAIARFWGLRFGLPHTNTRPDENIIIDVALQFLRGNYRPAFYDYPWLYMWTVAVLYFIYYVWGLASGAFQSVGDLLASWRVNWIPFFLIPRFLSATLGTATVLVAFRIGRRLWDDTTGLVAALFMALAFLHARDSHYGTTDTMMTFLMLASVSWLVDAHLDQRRRDFVVAGFLGGLAAATKYNALLVAAPFTTSYLLNILEEPGRRGRAMLDARVLLFGVPFLAGFAVGVPFLMFDFSRFLEHMKLLNASMGSGDLGHELSAGWIHHLEYSLRYGLGLPLLLAGIAGVLAILALQPRIGLLLFSFPIAYYVVAGSVRNLFFRYAIPLVPFLCIAAARLVTLVIPHAIPIRRRPALSSPLVAAAAVAIVLPSAVSTFQFDRIASQVDNRVVVARWFDSNVPAGSSVLMSGSLYGYVQFTREMGYKAWVWDRRRHIFVTDLDKRPGVGHPEWILVQDSPLPNETQPIVLEYLKGDYEFVRPFRAFSGDDDRVYDQQDAFYMPFSGFRGVERPGPNYQLYKRISAP